MFVQDHIMLSWNGPPTLRIKKICVLYYTLFVYKTCGILCMYYLQNIVIQNGILSHFLPPNKLALNKIRQKKIAKGDINQSEKHTIEY